MDKFQKYYLKKSQAQKGFLPYKSIYMKSESRQNKPMVIEVRNWLYGKWGEELTRKGHRRTFLDGNVLYFVWGAFLWVNSIVRFM